MNGGVAFVVSEKVFEHITTRALAFAEEQFPRMVFDTGMRPEAAAFVHDRVVDATADRIIATWAEEARHA